MVTAMIQKPPLTAEEEVRMFPLTDHMFAETGATGGTLWTPRELSDDYLQQTLDILNWRKKNKHNKRGDALKSNALVAEKMRREMLRQSSAADGGEEYAPVLASVTEAKTPAKASRAKAPRRTPSRPSPRTPRAVPKDVPQAVDELIITVADSTGRILGELIATPRTFKTGSTGYYASDKVKDSKTRSRYQVAIHVVKIGSRPDSTESTKTP